MLREFYVQFGTEGRLRKSKETQMPKYEYKTVNISFSRGFFKKKTPDVSKVLNREARAGWRFKQMILPASSFGESEQMVAILEKEIG